MFGLNPAKTRNPSMVGILALSILLASCGGEGDGSTGPAGGAPSVASRPAAEATGQLTVTVTDPGGAPLASARVQVNDTWLETDQNGMATFDRVPVRVRVSANHPLGYYVYSFIDVPQDGSNSHTLVIEPFSPVTVALFPVSAPAEGLSADRTELDLQFSLVASAVAPFVSASLETVGNPLNTPLLRLENCYVWLDALHVTPTCRYDFGGGNVSAAVSAYAYDSLAAASSPTAQAPYSALLLVDQSRRVAIYDPYDRRTTAAKNFIRGARTLPQADLIAVAGFAGAGGDVSTPLQLLQSPLWLPSGTLNAFTSDRLSQEATVDVLRPLVGGAAPVLDALGAAMTLTAAQAPADRRRAIVALLGGGDDSGLTETQQQVALESLRQQQVETGIQVILIAARLEEGSEDRRSLAALAAALRAPIIYAGYPRNFLDPRDGLYAALDLAADLLAGSALPSIKAVFRVKSNQPGGFRSGATLHGAISVESDRCPWSCWELPLEFAVRIP